MHLEIWVRDPGSEIWHLEKAIPDPDPGVKKYRILERNTEKVSSLSHYYVILFS